MRTFIIAEAGVNHNGLLEIAKKLIDVAVDVGADAVKFQTFKADKIVTRAASKARYQIKNMGTKESQLDMLKKLELSPASQRTLFSYCKKKQIIFMSTPFDEESADLLDQLGMSIFKIASGEITNKPLIQHVANKGKPIILSTGMSFLGEVEKAINWIRKVKKRTTCASVVQPLTLLHCVSNYPAALPDVNLLAMKTMEKALGLPVGYSDHTVGIEIPIAAVALGATVIEKHFTLDRDMPGPDHKASLEPRELKSMVLAIRNIEKAMGDGFKRPSPSELKNRDITRKSIVAAKEIKKGEVFTEENLTVKRPGTGISPMEWDKIIGRAAMRDFKEDELIEM